MGFHLVLWRWLYEVLKVLTIGSSALGNLWFIIRTLYISHQVAERKYKNMDEVLAHYFSKRKILILVVAILILPINIILEYKYDVLPDVTNMDVDTAITQVLREKGYSNTVLVENNVFGDGKVSSTSPRSGYAVNKSTPIVVSYNPLRPNGVYNQYNYRLSDTVLYSSQYEDQYGYNSSTCDTISFTISQDKLETLRMHEAYLYFQFSYSASLPNQEISQMVSLTKPDGSSIFTRHNKLMSFEKPYAYEAIRLDDLLSGFYDDGGIIRTGSYIISVYWDNNGEVASYSINITN